MTRDYGRSGSPSGPLNRERLAPAIKLKDASLTIRLGKVAIYDPKVAEDVERWVAEARWFPPRLGRGDGRTKHATSVSKAAVDADSAVEAIRQLANLLVTQWPAIQAELDGESVRAS